MAGNQTNLGNGGYYNTKYPVLFWERNGKYQAANVKIGWRTFPVNI
jgi:hypothetical protein